MPLFNAGQSLGLYRLGRQDAELRAEKARKLKEAAERKSAIQAVIDARMSGVGDGGQLGGQGSTLNDRRDAVEADLISGGDADVGALGAVVAYRVRGLRGLKGSICHDVLPLNSLLKGAVSSPHIISS